MGYTRKTRVFFISIVLFYDYKSSKMGICKIFKYFIHMVLFYDYKFSKMGISKILNNLFIWFFFIIINFQKWVYKAMRAFFACCFNILIRMWHIRYFFFIFYPAIIWTWEISLGKCSYFGAELTFAVANFLQKSLWF